MFSWALAVAGACVLLTTAEPGFARKRTRVVWTEVTVPKSERQAVREKHLLSVLKKEARKAQWGEPHDGLIEASVKVTEFKVERRPDVVRITCTAVGKLGRGPVVNTHFSFGGHPQKEPALESQMLLLVGRGVITRLASISRERHKPRRAPE